MTQQKHMRVWARHVAGLAILLTIIGTAASVLADACSGINDCKLEPQATLKLKGWQTKGWAYYCTNGYPYLRNWSKSGYKGISVTVNQFAEGNNPSKFDAIFTNWDPFKSQDVTITLGCSKISNGNTCTSTSADPKCPIVGKVNNYCSKGPVSACFQTWLEKCVPSGTEWSCTADQGLTWCTCK